jgi:hypothetical protein
VGPRAGLNEVEAAKISPLPGLELRPFGHPARIMSPYGLRSPELKNASEHAARMGNVTENAYL